MATSLAVLCAEQQPDCDEHADADGRLERDEQANEEQLASCHDGPPGLVMNAHCVVGEVGEVGVATEKYS